MQEVTLNWLFVINIAQLVYFGHCVLILHQKNLSLMICNVHGIGPYLPRVLGFNFFSG
jgi:hypothetical protein